ncbi:MAG: DUF4238 domain-containing protein [Armatimonadota bacterium]|nr:DUF4238 domain-containing protein [Armatimonadota bacterium]
MPSYKKNHTIPRFMLDYWIDPQTAHKGVHVYEVEKSRTYVSTGEGKTAYSFAIANDLYIHTGGISRAVGLEQWFSGLETVLARLVRQVHARVDPICYDKVEDPTLTVMALVGLECRSPYNLRTIQRALETDESLRAMVDPDSSVSPELQVKQNIIHSVTEYALDLVPTEMTFFVAPVSHSWLICDRPAFIDESDNTHFVMLTNKILLAYRRSADIHKSMYLDVTLDFLESANHMIALQARDWLVADSADQLNQYVGVFQSQEWQDGVNNERVVFQPIRNITMGWRISS